MYVIVTNHVNWHSENLQPDRENREKTGNLKRNLSGYPVQILHLIALLANGCSDKHRAQGKLYQKNSHTMYVAEGNGCIGRGQCRKHCCET